MKKQLLLLFCLAAAAALNAQTLKVMSYNIHHGADATEKDQLDNMARFIKASGADLVGLQEVDSVCRRSGQVDQMKRLAELTGMYYAFVRHRAYDGGAYGQGILSRYPVSDVRNDRITLLTGKNGSTALLSVKVTLPRSRSLNFASAHFALDSASRLVQAEETIRYLGSRGLPVILTGDLNTLPENRDVRLLHEQFAETDPQGLLTFPVKVPVKKIDYVLVSRQHLRKVKDYRVFNDIIYSDHLPVMATVQLR
ncbi:endonuclease/exonuclease/phosphatase family protein [Chitinophaga sp.]|uniref:endonuclease/exonuclease/phosphatase family protein n=1 Tax=Chitinophaga sp. TaxID=1869181 RepID=UPI0031D570D5